MKKITTFTLFIIFCNLAIAEPKPVRSCDRVLHINKTPTRAISHDINLTEMMFSLGLQEKMAGYTGVSGWQKLTPEFKEAARGVPQLSEKTPTLETLLAVDADFFFAGWRYGMRAGGPLTPHTLRPFGIAVYELTESCIHIMSKKTSSFDDVYRDILNLGIIFDVESRAQNLISKFKSDVLKVTKKTRKIHHPVSVFLYDSGKTSPFTAGAFSIPTAMIQAAGGKNILDDLHSSWARTNWEVVVDRNPDVIIIVNYGKTTAADKVKFLMNHPALSNVNAIKNQRFVTLEYSEATPGVRNFDATLRLARAFHPQVFMSKSYQADSSK